jgi:DNA anti-recombination protein RmuC
VDQADIDAVLARLSDLKAQVKATREMLKPLEEGLEQAKREYQDRVGPLLRQINKLRAEVAELDDQIRVLEDAEETPEPTGPGPDNGMNHGFGDTTAQAASAAPKDGSSPIDLEKDQLLELARRLLDPDANPSDASLIGEIDGMVSNPAVTLADILERLPWGVVWVQAAVTEDLAVQFRRLSGWERALANQLASLKRGEERLRRDSRYPLWQRQQQSAAAWQAYLADVERQLQDETTSQEQRRADRQARLLVLMKAT